MLAVICFDVADDRRRRALVRVLESYGFRVQESVFECWLAPAAFARLKMRVSSTILSSEDSVIYYHPATERAEIALLLAGAAPFQEPQEKWFEGMNTGNSGTACRAYLML